MGRQNQRAKADVFRKNLRALIRHEGWTQSEAAERLGADIPLRKYLSSGLANITEKNRPLLERICTKLGVSKIELLWAPNLKPHNPARIYADAEAESLIFQLNSLLNDCREETAVEKICNAIEAAFSRHVLKIKEAKERARGGGYVDKDASGMRRSKNWRRGVRSKKREEED